MKKFKFTLQSVHNTREAKREREQLELAEKQTVLAEAVAALAAVELRRQQATDDFAAKIAANRIDAFEMDLTTKYLNALAGRENEARQNILRAEEECQAQSRRVAHAAQEVEATAKLRERHQRQFLLDAARAEQTALDEIIAVNFARNLTEAKR